MRKFTLPWLTWGFLAALIGTAYLAEASEPNKYETGYASIARISEDLHRALEPRQRQALLARPVVLSQMTTPYAQPCVYVDGARTCQAVQISAGFIDLMNSLSHAKAIDGDRRGYLKQYLSELSNGAAEESLYQLRNVSDTKSWSFDTMNHQVSHFNQTVGALLGIEMAYHYLGYYAKHGSKLGTAQQGSVPITQFLSVEEWRKAVLKGARNALDCGFGVEGLKTFFECLEKMPTRPAWAAYFLHDKANVSKIKKDLDKLEEYFFAGRIYE